MQFTEEHENDRLDLLEKYKAYLFNAFPTDDRERLIKLAEDITDVMILQKRRSKMAIVPSDAFEE